MSKLPSETTFQSTGYLLASGIGSCFPGVGGVVGELISRRRAARMEFFLSQLAERIDDLEEAQTVIQQPACMELLEESSEQAIRGESEFRRIALARLMANSINDKMEKHETDRLLLAILRDLTDYELLHLLAHMSHTPNKLNQEYIDIINKHKNITHPRRSHFGSSRDEVDAHIAQDAHKDRLAQIGLFEKKISSNRISYQTSKLGRLLLRRIGAIPHE